MKKAIFLSRQFRALLVILLLSNFSAFAQNTTIWLVNHAETDGNSENLSAIGQQRATDLLKALKHEGVEVIYVTNKKSSLQTANPLAFKDKILPRVYTDSVQKFAEIIKQNFIGKNVLIIADYGTIIPFISAFGGDAPFDSLDKDDYDQLFCIVLKSSGNVSSTVRYYGKAHHTNAIPQSAILDNFSPGLPGH